MNDHQTIYRCRDNYGLCDWETINAASPEDAARAYTEQDGFGWGDEDPETPFLVEVEGGDIYKVWMDGTVRLAYA